MHSISSRVNAIASYAVLVLFVALAVNVASHFFLTKAPSVSVGYAKLQQIGASNRKLMTEYTGELKPNQAALFALFDLDADFRPVWTWNTKLLFVYVSVDYKTPDGMNHTVFIWDTIIQTKDKAVLCLKEHIPEYYIVDVPDNLRNAKARLTVSWNVVPISGLLMTYSARSETSFSVPAKIEMLEQETTQRKNHYW